MSPRGVAVPEIRRRLFESARRVLVRDGPGGLSGRAITREAKVATGLLYNHFGDLDGFLAEFIVDSARRTAGDIARLTACAGVGAVADNLTQAALAFGAHLPAVAELLAARPALAARLHEALPAKPPTLEEIQEVFAGYLDAERDRGRLAATADTGAIALAIVAAAHHLFTISRVAEPGEELRRIVAALMAGAASAGSTVDM